jgi:hypothetical protein
MVQIFTAMKMSQASSIGFWIMRSLQLHNFLLQFSGTKKIFLHLKGKQTKVPLITEANEYHNKPASLSTSFTAVHFLFHLQICKSKYNTD